jgi:hypothetical protein
MKKILFFIIITLTFISCDSKEKVIKSKYGVFKLQNDGTYKLVDKEIEFSPNWKNCTYAGKQYNWDFTPDYFETLIVIDSIFTIIGKTEHMDKSPINYKCLLCYDEQQKEIAKNKVVISKLQKKYKSSLSKLTTHQRKKVDEYYQVTGNKMIDKHIGCCLAPGT